METWSRLATFIWPYRRRLVLSFVFGCLAAASWSITLALTFPITVTFGEQKTLAKYVRDQIDKSVSEVAEHAAELQHHDKTLKELPENGDPDRKKEHLRIRNQVRRVQEKMDTKAFRIWMLTRFDALVLPRLPKDSFQLFALIFGLVLVVSLIKGLCSFAQDVIAGSVAELVVIDMRQAIFRRALKLDPQTIALNGTPQLMSDCTYTLQTLAYGVSELGGRIVREPLKAIACIGAMFYLNWQLTMLLLCFVPIAGWMFHVFGQRLRRATRGVIDTMTRMYKNLEETLINVKAVIIFDMAGFQRRQFHQRNHEFYTESMKCHRIDAASGAAVEFLTVFAVLAVLLPAAYLMLRHETTIWGVRLATFPPTLPELTVFYALLAGVIDPVRKFSKFYNTIRQTGTMAEQIFRRMDCDSLVKPPTAPQLLPQLQTGIEFRDIHFSYARLEADVSQERGTVLKGLHLRVNHGETIAIVGPNGSGKSTLVGLIPRFFDPSRGAVLFDDIDLRNVRLQDLRDQIAIVPQDTLLFDTTIAENIRYGDLNATETQLRDAARRARVLEFSDQLPLGLETPVGEGGKQLSGGQRQRVALARAILRNPNVLILDEPTSAIDAQSELLIHASLKEFVGGRTTLIITHTLSPALLEYVSRIVVLDHGCVVASGSHVELQATCPVYQQLWDHPRTAAA